MYMKESSRSEKNSGWVAALLEPGFNLPDGSDFHSQPAKMTYAQFLELSEKHLPAFNSSPYALASRLERKFDEPFVL